MLLNDEAVGMIDGVVAQSGATLTSFVGYSTGERDSTAVNQRISQLCSNFDTCDTTSLIADQVVALRIDLQVHRAFSVKIFHVLRFP